MWIFLILNGMLILREVYLDLVFDKDEKDCNWLKNKVGVRLFLRVWLVWGW